MNSNVVQFPLRRSEETMLGVSVTFIRNSDGTVSWEFVKPVGALRMTGTAESMEIARSRAESLIRTFPGSRNAGSPSK